jgi:hypothetical protein
MEFIQMLATFYLRILHVITCYLKKTKKNKQSYTFAYSLVTEIQFGLP